MKNRDFWDSSRDYMRVEIKDLQVEMQLGLHPWEQHPERPSRLIINIEMFAHLSPDQNSNDRSEIIDYDEIRNELKTWSKRPHTLLIETLLNELVVLCFKNTRVEACRVSIRKPDIFNEAASAGVEFYRVREK